jgi:hypothetical protein
VVLRGLGDRECCECRRTQLQLDALSCVDSDVLGVLRTPLVSCLDTLGQLLTVIDAGQVVTADLLLSTSHRAMESVGNLLRCLLPPHPTPLSAQEVLTTVLELSTCILTLVLPCLIANSKGKRSVTPAGTVRSAADVDDILQSLATSICVPVIQAFRTVSISTTMRVFSKECNKKNASNIMDIRPDLLGLLRGVMSSVDKCTTRAGSGATNGLRERLALEALGEVEQLSRKVRGSVEEASQECGKRLDAGGKEERVNELARKDGFWYVCCVLRLVARGGSGEIPQRLCRVIRDCDQGGRCPSQGRENEVLKGKRRVEEGVLAGVLELVTQGNGAP